MRRDLLGIALLAPAPSVGVVLAGLAMLHPEWELKQAGELAFVVGKLWMLCLPIVWRLLVDRRRLTFSPARRGGFRVAAVTGVLLGGLIVGGYLLLGPILVDLDAARSFAASSGLDQPARYLSLVAFWVCANSVLEEFVYRWFILEKSARLGVWGSALFSSALFTVHHVIALRVQFDWNVTLLASAGVFIGGAVWSWLYLRYRSIWPAYVSHAIVDVAVFVIGWRIIFA